MIDEKIFCMHGGLSPDLKNVEQIHKIPRPIEVPDQGMLCDLLWSDPDKENSKDWEENERGVSYTFGINVVKVFLKDNEFDLIC